MAKDKQTKRIGAKPIPSNNSAPPEPFPIEPGIHTHYDQLGGYSEGTNKFVELNTIPAKQITAKQKSKSKAESKQTNAQCTAIVKVYPKSKLPFESLCDYLKEVAVVVRELRKLADLIEKIGAGHYTQAKANKILFLVSGLLPMDVVELGNGCTRGGPKKTLTETENDTKNLILDCLERLDAVSPPGREETARELRGIAETLTKTWGVTEASGETGDNMQAISETTKRRVEAIRDQVFICYSHKDKQWLDNLQTHLKPYVRNGLTAWSDKQIAPGSKWLPEIETALNSAKVAVLLVTPNFLASDFIHEKELGPLLKKDEKGNVRIIWIPVRACSYKETPLKDYQAAGESDKPLANMKKADRDKAFVKICEEIKKAVSR